MKKDRNAYCKMLDFFDSSFSHIFLSFLSLLFLKINNELYALTEYLLSVLFYVLNFSKSKTLIAFEITDNSC